MFVHWIVSLVIAGIAGLVASKLINKTGSGLLMDVLLGIVGGLIGHAISNMIPPIAALDAQPGLIGFAADVAIAAAGAALVIVVWNMLFRKSAAS